MSSIYIESFRHACDNNCISYLKWLLKSLLQRLGNLKSPDFLHSADDFLRSFFILQQLQVSIRLVNIRHFSSSFTMNTIGSIGWTFVKMITWESLVFRVNVLFGPQTHQPSLVRIATGNIIRKLFPQWLNGLRKHCIDNINACNRSGSNGLINVWFTIEREESKRSVTELKYFVICGTYCPIQFFNSYSDYVSVITYIDFFQLFFTKNALFYLNMFRFRKKRHFFLKTRLKKQKSEKKSCRMFCGMCCTA